MQLIIFSLAFFLFTSTIEISPWYEPLTMWAFMLLMIITPIQIIAAIPTKKSLIHNHSNAISKINSSILVLAVFISINSEKLFYLFAIVCSAAQCLLAIAFIFTITERLEILKK